MLVTHYRYVVVDNSSRLDAVSRLVGNLSECVLIWSLARMWLPYGAPPACNSICKVETGNRERLRLVLKAAFARSPALAEADAENAFASVRLLWRVPNQYFAISSSIDRGAPVMEQSACQRSHAVFQDWRRS